MTQFHAVMLDECGGEFGADVYARTKDEAYNVLKELYPESRIDQLESPADTAAREKTIYDRISASYDDGDYYDYEDDF